MNVDALDVGGPDAFAMKLERRFDRGMGPTA